MGLTLGGDPEFALIDFKTRNAVPANKFIRDDDCDKGVGLDGCQAIGEFRFPPHNRSSSIVKEIKTRMETLDGLIPSDVDVRGGPGVWKTYSDGVQEFFPLGGHVHIGDDDETFDVDFVRLLHDSLAVPISCVMPGKLRALRIECGYGNIGGSKDDFRRQSYGIEYRILPSWIHHPRLVETIYDIVRVLVRNREHLIAEDNDTVTKIINNSSQMGKLPITHSLKVFDVMKTINGFSAIEENVNWLRKVIETGPLPVDVDALSQWGIREPRPRRFGWKCKWDSRHPELQKIAMAIGSLSRTVFISISKHRQVYAPLLESRYDEDENNDLTDECDDFCSAIHRSWRRPKSCHNSMIFWFSREEIESLTTEKLVARLNHAILMLNRISKLSPERRNDYR